MKSTRAACWALIALPVVAIAGCSSGSSGHADSTKKAEASSVTRASSTSSTSATSATSAPANTTPCTVAGASAVLSPDTATSIVCGAGWAAGSAYNPNVDYAFLLHDVNGTWTNVASDQATMQQACATANPLGIPQNVLAVSPCMVS